MALEEITWATETPWQEIFKHITEEYGGHTPPTHTHPRQERGWLVWTP